MLWTNFIELMAKYIIVLSIFTQTEDERFTKGTEEAGSHTAPSTIRKCGAQQRSWVSGWLHSVLVAQWPPVQGSAAFLANAKRKKKIPS